MPPVGGFYLFAIDLRGNDTSERFATKMYKKNYRVWNEAVNLVGARE